MYHLIRSILIFLFFFGVVLCASAAKQLTYTVEEVEIDTRIVQFIGAFIEYEKGCDFWNNQKGKKIQAKKGGQGKKIQAITRDQKKRYKLKKGDSGKRYKLKKGGKGKKIQAMTRNQKKRYKLQSVLV